LSNAISFLASHPEAQERIVEEYRRVLKDRKELDLEDLKELSFTQAVIKETLRLMPIATGVPKEAVEDTELGGYFVPKGMIMFIDMVNLHRNPKYWKDPSTFNPDRFLTDEVTANSYLPFSLGSRSCIGAKFAETQMITSLPLLLNHFKLSQPEGCSEPNLQKVKQTIVLFEPLVPIKIRITPRI